jgi:hypothetical protein
MQSLHYVISYINDNTILRKEKERMSLVVNFSRVKTEMTEQEQFHMGLYLTVIGVPAITQDSLAEIQLRDRVFRAVVPFHRDTLGESDRNAHSYNWETYLGLSVNGSYETRSKWFKRIANSYLKPISSKVARRL